MLYILLLKKVIMNKISKAVFHHIKHLHSSLILFKISFLGECNGNFGDFSFVFNFFVPFCLCKRFEGIWRKCDFCWSWWWRKPTFQNLRTSALWDFIPCEITAHFRKKTKKNLFHTTLTEINKRYVTSNCAPAFRCKAKIVVCWKSFDSIWK